MLAIVIPTHKPSLTTLEIRRLKITFKTNYSAPKFFAVPDSLDVKWYSDNFPKAEIARFPHKYFSSVMEYSKLMLNPFFYQYFEGLNFQWLLLSQADSFVVRDVGGLMTRGFDYVGAAWNPEWRVHNALFRYLVNQSFPLSLLPTAQLTAGNGGLSLRRLAAMKEITDWFHGKYTRKKFMKDKKLIMNEDLIIAFGCTKLKKSIASYEESNKIFIETTPVESVNVREIFGFHALDKYQIHKEESLLEFFENELEIC